MSASLITRHESSSQSAFVFNGEIPMQTKYLGRLIGTLFGRICTRHHPRSSCPCTCTKHVMSPHSPEYFLPCPEECDNNVNAKWPYAPFEQLQQAWVTWQPKHTYHTAASGSLDIKRMINGQADKRKTWMSLRSKLLLAWHVVPSPTAETLQTFRHDSPVKLVVSGIAIPGLVGCRKARIIWDGLHLQLAMWIADELPLMSIRSQRLAIGSQMYQIASQSAMLRAGMMKINFKSMPLISLKVKREAKKSLRMIVWYIQSLLEPAVFSWQNKP